MYKGGEGGGRKMNYALNSEYLNKIERLKYLRSKITIGREHELNMK